MAILYASVKRFSITYKHVCQSEPAYLNKQKTSECALYSFMKISTKMGGHSCKITELSLKLRGKSQAQTTTHTFIHFFTLFDELRDNMN